MNHIPEYLYLPVISTHSDTGNVDCGVDPNVPWLSVSDNAVSVTPRHKTIVSEVMGQDLKKSWVNPFVQMNKFNFLQRTVLIAYSTVPFITVLEALRQDTKFDFNFCSSFRKVKIRYHKCSFYMRPDLVASGLAGNNLSLECPFSLQCWY